LVYFTLQVVGGNPGVLLSVAFALRIGKTLEEGKKGETPDDQRLSFPFRTNASFEVCMVVDASSVPTPCSHIPC
jgi:hypothetical protein